MKKKRIFGVVIFLSFLQNGIGKDQKCIVFPESWYVNSNPGVLLDTLFLDKNAMNQKDTEYDCTSFKISHIFYQVYLLR